MARDAPNDGVARGLSIT